MKIAIGNDHVAIEMKKDIMAHLNEKGYAVTDFGFLEGEAADYPAYGEKVARLVANGTFDLGVLLCGTGAGMAIVANKIPGVRAVVCSEPCTARLAREHNDANILCFGARVIGTEMAKTIMDAWLGARFQGGRHRKRVEMIKALEDRGNLRGGVF